MCYKIRFAGPLLLLMFFNSCKNNGFQHCLFNNKLHVNGYAELVTDSTLYFPDGDTLSNAKLIGIISVQFTRNGDWHGGSNTEMDFYDTTDVGYSFDIMGKFSRNRLLQQDRNKYANQGQIKYNHVQLYNTEEDYVSSATGAGYLRYVYKYVENCNLLEFSQMNEDQKVEKKYVFQYNDSQNLTECNMYNESNRLVKQVKYSYDKNNRETGYSINYSPKVVFNYNFTYHDNDTLGNWQKRVKYKNNKPIAITMRRIKYY